jgi:hypothetical protein
MGKENGGWNNASQQRKLLSTELQMGRGKTERTWG